MESRSKLIFGWKITQIWFFIVKLFRFDFWLTSHLNSISCWQITQKQFLVKKSLKLNLRLSLKLNLWLTNQSNLIFGQKVLKHDLWLRRRHSNSQTRFLLPSYLKTRFLVDKSLILDFSLTNHWNSIVCEKFFRIRLLVGKSFKFIFY